MERVQIVIIDQVHKKISNVYVERYNLFCLAVNELETEGRNAIESPTSPLTITPDTFVLGKCFE